MLTFQDRKHEWGKGADPPKKGGQFNQGVKGGGGQGFMTDVCRGI